MGESYDFSAAPIINKKHVFLENKIRDLLVLGAQEELKIPGTLLRCGRYLEVGSVGLELSRVTSAR